MKFFEDKVAQATKKGKIVCGDSYLCARALDYTEFVVCDGIGSGVYANIAAISCASRLLELFRTGVSQELACEMVAESMHRARKEDMPFSAFTAARILHDGQFTVYSYEAPPPVLIKDGTASVLKPHFHPVGGEVLGESSGTLNVGDCLVLCSDGITQAGLGRGYTYGIGPEGLTNYLNRCLLKNVPVFKLPGKTLDFAELISGMHHEDDATIALIRCREAREVTVLSGPPTYKSKDKAFVERFMNAPGKHVICGSTTAEIVGRELGREVLLMSSTISFSAPPEYYIEGIDLITEGAVALNQIYNILGEDTDKFVSNTSVERVCMLLRNADAVTLMIGRALNTAHLELVFKQLGIRPREATIRLLADKLRAMGKLVVEEYY